MAATYTSVSIDGTNKDAIIVDGTGTTQRVILKEFLSNFDQKVMDDISDETGANFFAKMQAHTLNNGLSADDVYDKFIVNSTDYSALVGRAKTNADRIDALETDVDQLQVDVADHETRITTLEP